jgi:hypothetical protein
MSTDNLYLQQILLTLRLSNAIGGGSATERYLSNSVNLLQRIATAPIPWDNCPQRVLNLASPEVTVNSPTKVTIRPSSAAVEMQILAAIVDYTSGATSQAGVVARARSNSVAVALTPVQAAAVTRGYCFGKTAIQDLNLVNNVRFIPFFYDPVVIGGGGVGSTFVLDQQVQAGGSNFAGEALTLVAAVVRERPLVPAFIAVTLPFTVTQSTVKNNDPNLLGTFTNLSDTLYTTGATTENESAAVAHITFDLGADLKFVDRITIGVATAGAAALNASFLEVSTDRGLNWRRFLAITGAGAFTSTFTLQTYATTLRLVRPSGTVYLSVAEFSVFSY